MALPAILAGVSLGSKLLGGLFGGNAKKKQASAAKKADDAAHRAQMDAFDRTGAAHGVDERRRGARLEGIQHLIRGAASGSYGLPPDLLARLQEASPFTGVAPTRGADPGAGLGSSLLSGLFGTVGGLADTAQAGLAQRPPARPPTTPPLNPQGFTPFDPRLNRR
jgi:hypothetical protein